MYLWRYRYRNRGCTLAAFIVGGLFLETASFIILTDFPRTEVQTSILANYLTPIQIKLANNLSETRSKKLFLVTCILNT